MSVSSGVLYAEHVESNANKAAQEIEYIFNARKYFSAEQMLTQFNTQCKKTVKFVNKLSVRDM